jgi:uncharacterized GH25 family protein
MKSRCVWAFLPIFLAPPVAQAHEFWIEPATFHPEAGSILSARLQVGIGPHEQESFARNEEHQRRFALVAAGAEKAMVGRPGDDPAGRVRLEEEGLQWVAYASNPSRIELGPEKFEQYLVEEGLEQVRSERAEMGESEHAASESYRRCAKSLVRVGDGPTAGFDQVLGLELELVLETDPAVLGTDPTDEEDSSIALRLLYKGRAAVGVQVLAISLEDTDVRLKARTDEEGRVRVQLPRNGRWLYSAVHMRRAEPTADVDWMSCWSSLTLAVD